MEMIKLQYHSVCAIFIVGENMPGKGSLPVELQPMCAMSEEVPFGGEGLEHGGGR